jgi:hypothetical protein
MTSAIHSPDLNERAHAILNSVSFCFAQIHTHYERICNLIEFYHQRPEPEDVIGAAWDVIDWVERLRKLLHKGAGIKKKEAWYQAAIRKLEPAEEIRCFLQHFDTGIEECLRSQLSVFGYVAACRVAPDASGWEFLVANSDRERLTDLRDRDVWFRKDIPFSPPVDHIRLLVVGRTANLTVLYKVVIQIEESFQDFVGRTYRNSQPAGSDGKPALQP